MDNTAIAFAIVNFMLGAILVGIAGTWIYFLGTMAKSFKMSPRLESFNAEMSKERKYPKVSVILPARNEEKYIARCLDSIIAQDYQNFEIIAINDSSTDRTGEIMVKYAEADPRVVYVEADPKPEGWAGKNWACHQGYLKASGDLLLFTDADTKHSPHVMSLAASHLIHEGLDALTAVPKLICEEFWTKVTLPSLSTFLHTRFSPLRVNNPKLKTGYFFGSFFIITRKTYEAVGTHESVKHELVEDGALGAKVKSEKFKMKMVRGEHEIEAVWARDFKTLWQGLRRLMIPMYYQNKSAAVLMTIAIFFILLEPFILLPYSSFAASIDNFSGIILFLINLFTVSIMILTTAIQCKLGVYQSPAFALASPAGSAIVVFGFMSAIADARKKDSVSWRDRNYTVSESQSQHPIT